MTERLMSSILSWTSFQMGKPFWGVVGAVVEQSRRKTNMVAQGERKFGPRGWPQTKTKPKNIKMGAAPFAGKGSQHSVLDVVKPVAFLALESCKNANLSYQQEWPCYHAKLLFYQNSQWHIRRKRLQRLVLRPQKYNIWTTLSTKTINIQAHKLISFGRFNCL